MTKWIDVNGAKIEKCYFDENVAEAKTYKWEAMAWQIEYGDHSHCMICEKAIPDRLTPNALFYKSTGGWLCKYCHDNFL